MRIHTLQHVSFEGLGSMADWFAAQSLHLGVTRVYESATFPDPANVDLLVVVGGPMSANDEAILPWLAAEKHFIREVIRRGKTVLGICLGAQLVASVLGAPVFRNRVKEIGWFPVTPDVDGGAGTWSGLLPGPIEAFHWHGETFELPEGAIRLAHSDACLNQAFAWGNHVLGLQFHVEFTPETARRLVEHCPGDLIPGPYVQPPSDFLARPERFERANRVMETILEHLLTRICHGDSLNA